MEIAIKSNLLSMNTHKLGFLLLGLLPLIGSLGRSLFYIDLVLIGLLFLNMKINDFNNIKTPFHPFVVSIFLYFLATILINILNYKLPYSNAYPKNISVFITTTLFLFIFSSFCLNFKKNIPFLIQVTFYSVACVNLLIIIGFLLDINIVHSLKMLEIVKFKHTFFHSAQSFFVVPIGIFIYYTLNNKTILNYLAITSILLGTLLSQGRTAILTLSVGITIFFIYYLQKKIKTIYILISILIIAFITIILISYISSGNFIEFEKIHTSGRLDGFNTYISYLIKKESTFLGLGILGDNNMYFSGLIPFKHPHNIFVEALITMGILGLVTLFIFIISLFIYIFKLIKISEDEFSKPLLLSTLSTFIISSLSFWSIWSKTHLVLILFYLFLSILIIDKKYIVK